MLLQLMVGALAAPDCETLDRNAFRAAVVDAQRALRLDDLDVATDQIAVVEDNIECMTFAPEPRLLAELLVAIAVARFAEGEPWEAPLAAALRIRPNVDRLVGVAHPMYAWEPPEPQPLEPVESKHDIYVDGRLQGAIPPDDGWYLVQKTDGSVWNTTWKQDAPISRAWVLEPVVRPPRIGFQLELSGSTGVFYTQQKTNTAANRRSVYDLYYELPSDSEEPVIESAYNQQCDRTMACGGMLAFEARGALTLFSRFGLSGVANVLIGMRPGVTHFRLGAIHQGRRFRAGLGVAVLDLPRGFFGTPFKHEDGVYVGSSVDDFQKNKLSVDFQVDNRMFGYVELQVYPWRTLRLELVYGIHYINSMFAEVAGQLRVARLPRLFDATVHLGMYARGGYGQMEQLTDSEMWMKVRRAETGFKFVFVFGSVP